MTYRELHYPRAWIIEIQAFFDRTTESGRTLKNSAAAQYNVVVDTMGI